MKNLVVNLKFTGLDHLKEISTSSSFEIETTCTGRTSVNVNILKS